MMAVYEWAERWTCGPWAWYNLWEESYVFVLLGRVWEFVFVALAMLWHFFVSMVLHVLGMIMFMWCVQCRYDMIM